ncbi:MAG: hypothetical protein FJW86_07885 [Actinobacteria bacterium]|nr:hypothetical protein [Actinomycetota bacterium]
MPVKVSVWLLRSGWITLPLTAGPAASDAISTFADAPRVAAAVGLFIAWGAGAVAVLAPHPMGLTLLRAVAPCFALLAIGARVADQTTGAESWGAIAATVIVMLLVSSAGVARAAANGIAYGDEDRFPLRAPPALFIGPIPVARLLAIGGLATGPLLLADEQVLGGVIALVLGVPVAVFAGRALHALSLRWLVVVPAGVVIVDPMTLSDPVLFVRRQVRALRPLSSGTSAPHDAVDLRLGAVAGTVLLDLGEDVEILQRSRGRRSSANVAVHRLLIAVVHRDQMLHSAARRVPVEAR